MQMELILLKNVRTLGRIGETVRVAMGYGRYLLRQQAALRASEDSKASFQIQKEQLEALNLQHKADAQTLASVLEGKIFILVRQAGEAGHLYGSVSARDIADVLAQDGFSIGRDGVALLHPIKTIGAHKVNLALHADVQTHVHIIVAKSLDEAETQRRKLTPAALPVTPSVDHLDDSAHHEIDSHQDVTVESVTAESVSDA